MTATAALTYEATQVAPAAARPLPTHGCPRRGGGRAGLVWWDALGAYGPARAIHAGQLQSAGPTVIGFILVVLVLERRWPAQPRPLLARGYIGSTSAIS